MDSSSDIPFQPGLFDNAAASFDGSYADVERIELDAECWVDLGVEWLGGADALFRTVLATRSWSQRMRWMYDRELREPRLTAPWTVRSGIALEPAILEEMRTSLGARYRVQFDAVGFNLYRDGRDSVAWHRDHILREIGQPVIALVSLGERRRFLMRPAGGGRSRTFMLGRGDLLVTGGKTNLKWEHTVPKVPRAGPRISLAFRYGMDLGAYAHKRPVDPDHY
jgi:alkylated DNA repair dioxygenase AlkB